MLDWSAIRYVDGSPLPPGRWGHSFTLLLPSPYAVAIGGLSAGEMRGDVWLFDITASKWVKPLLSGQPPSERWGHTATLIGQGCIAVLGGREGSKPRSLAEIYILDLKAMAWSTLTTPSPAPKSRYAHSALWLGDDTRQILVFGGHGGRSRYYNDVHLLRVPSTWSTTAADTKLGGNAEVDAVASSGSGSGGGGGGGLFASLIPSAWRRSASERSADATTLVAHDVTASGNSVVQASSMVSGAGSGSGSGGGGAAAATLSTDADMFTSSQQAVWLTPTVSGTPPTKRSGHTMCRIGDRVFVIGGYNGSNILRDMAVLHLPTWTWSTPHVGGSGLPPLVGHSADVVPGTNHIVVFGGSVSATELAFSMYVIDTDTMASTALHQQRAPAPRFWHRTVVLPTPATRPRQRSNSSAAAAQLASADSKLGLSAAGAGAAGNIAFAISRGSPSSSSHSKLHAAPSQSQQGASSSGGSLTGAPRGDAVSTDSMDRRPAPLAGVDLATGSSGAASAHLTSVSLVSSPHAQFHALSALGGGTGIMDGSAAPAGAEDDVATLPPGVNSALRMLGHDIDLGAADDIVLPAGGGIFGTELLPSGSRPRSVSHDSDAGVSTLSSLLYSASMLGEGGGGFRGVEGGGMVLPPGNVYGCDVQSSISAPGMHPTFASMSAAPRDALSAEGVGGVPVGGRATFGAYAGPHGVYFASPTSSDASGSGVSGGTPRMNSGSVPFTPSSLVLGGQASGAGGSGAAALSDTPISLAGAHIIVFGGCGERGQAYNDMAACDLSALLHGDDLAQSLALADTIVEAREATTDLHAVESSSTGAGAACGAHFVGSNAFEGDAPRTEYASNVEGGIVMPARLEALPSSAQQPTASTGQLRPTSRFFRDATAGLSPHSADHGDAHSRAGSVTTSLSKASGVPLSSASGVSVGLVTRKATAPSMAVGMGGVGKVPAPSSSSVLSGASAGSSGIVATRANTSDTNMAASVASVDRARGGEAGAHHHHAHSGGRHAERRAHGGGGAAAGGGMHHAPHMYAPHSYAGGGMMPPPPGHPYAYGGGAPYPQHAPRGYAPPVHAREGSGGGGAYYPAHGGAPPPPGMAGRRAPHGARGGASYPPPPEDAAPGYGGYADYYGGYADRYDAPPPPAPEYAAYREQPTRRGGGGGMYPHPPRTRMAGHYHHSMPPAGYGAPPPPPPPEYLYGGSEVSPSHYYYPPDGAYRTGGGGGGRPGYASGALPPGSGWPNHGEYSPTATAPPRGGAPPPGGMYGAPPPGPPSMRADAYDPPPIAGHVYERGAYDEPGGAWDGAMAGGGWSSQRAPPHSTSASGPAASTVPPASRSAPPSREAMREASSNGHHGTAPFRWPPSVDAGGGAGGGSAGSAPASAFPWQSQAQQQPLASGSGGSSALYRAEHALPVQEYAYRGGASAGGTLLPARMHGDVYSSGMDSASPHSM